MGRRWAGSGRWGTVAAVPVEPPPHVRLEDAVAGLSGIVGFWALPTLLSYVRLLLEVLERRGGLSAGRGVSSVRLAKAAVLTVVTAFFAYAWVRAATDLRDLQLEAPVLGPSLQGAVVGAAVYLVYSAGLSVLRRRGEHRRWERRLRGPRLG